MPKLFYIVLGFLVLFAVATAVMIHQFQLLGAIIMALVFFGLFYAAYVAAGRSLKRLFMAPFLAQGSVLRNARAQVHHISEARRQSVQDLHRRKLGDDEEGDSDEEPALPRNIRYINIDVTIRPTSPAKAFARWDPTELLLVPFQSKGQEHEREVPTGYVEHWELHFEGRFIEPEGADRMPLDRQRIKVLFAVPENFRRVKFQYYGFHFGDIDLGEPRKEVVPEELSAEEQKRPPVDPDGERGRSVQVTNEGPVRPSRRKQKNRVKNTQRLNLSLLAETEKAQRSAEDGDPDNPDELAVPPWAVGKRKGTNGGGPRSIMVPEDDEEWDDDDDDDAREYRNRNVRTTNRINIPPAPRFTDDESGGSSPARRPEPVPLPVGADDEEDDPMDDAPASRQGNGYGGDTDPAPEKSESTPAARQGQPEETSSTPEPEPARTSQPGTEGTAKNPVKPLKVDPQPISAKSTAVKQSTLTQRLMALSQGKAAGDTAPSADLQETQPWQKPKHPEMLKEPEPAPAKPEPKAETSPPQARAQSQPEARKFFVARDGKPTGPYSMADVRQLVEDGSITEKDHAWTEGLPYWVTVASILYNYS